jgi:hypothetical protein
MHTLTAVSIATVCMLVGCSKSPVEATVDAANAVATKLVMPLAQKDASKEVEGLIRNLQDRSDCDAYKARLREAGRGPPAAGGTQMVIVHTYDDAMKAGCGKTN